MAAAQAAGCSAGCWVVGAAIRAASLSTSLSTREDMGSRSSIMARLLRVVIMGRRSNRGVFGIGVVVVVSAVVRGVVAGKRTKSQVEATSNDFSYWDIILAFIRMVYRFRVFCAG